MTGVYHLYEKGQNNAANHYECVAAQTFKKPDEAMRGRLIASRHTLIGLIDPMLELGHNNVCIYFGEILKMTSGKEFWSSQVIAAERVRSEAKCCL